MKKQKHRFLRKMLAVLLSAVLTVGMTTTAMPATASSQTHSHEICIGSVCSSPDHTSIEWTPWTDSASLPAVSGNYYLDTDVNLTDIWSPTDGTSLCLNGHTITQTADSNPVIEIDEGITFTLCDCADVFGKLTGGKSSGVYSSGSFTMYGGEISGNSYGSGGGVNNSGSFYLYGGKISRNTASTYRGGGVYNSSKGVFIMYGGEISGNRNRGSAGMSGGGGVATEGTFAMYGGTISSNESYDSRSSGVFFVNGTMKLGKTAVIKDNKSSDSLGNLYLYAQAPPLIIDPDNPLTEGAHIGIGLYNNEEAFTGENDVDYSQYFHSDDAPYYIVVKGESNELRLEHRHVYTKYEGTPADCSNPGMKTFWVCEGCYSIYADAEGTIEILDENDLMIPQREHAYVWKHNEDSHWQECKYEDCGDKQGDSSPHTYDGNNDMTCNDCSYDRSALDKNTPTGTITIGKDTWNSVLSTVNYNLFFREAVQVTITAQDTAGTLNSGVDKVYYHLSEKVLTETEVTALNAADWIETPSLSFSADSEGKCVIYIKITDKAGNITYLSSDGLVFDKLAPVISGVTDGETYNSPQEVTVTDENLESVKVNGTTVSLLDNKFTLETAETPQTITAADKADNITEITVTVTEKPAHVHDWKTDAWEKDENGHWHPCNNTDCPITENSKKDGYGAHIYSSNSDMTCNDCGYDRTALDTNAPTGTITLDTNSWKEFLNTITFGLFFKETKEAVITAEDTAGNINSGVDKIYCHVSEKALTEAEVTALGAADWTETASVSLNPDKKCVVYSKITDKAGNTAYLSSDGLVFDGTAPVINAADGASYTAPVFISVDDSYLDKVMVNGTQAALTDGNLLFDTAGEYTITAVDKAGNTTEVTITITEKPSHTHDYGNKWESDKTNHWHECSCGEKKDTAAHMEDNGTVTKAPTKTETGIKTFKCIVCAYVMRTETIPAADGGKGNIHTDIEKGENTPDTRISTPANDLIDSILTEAEKQQMENGTNIKIVLDVKDASDSVSSQDKTAIESALDSFTTGQYLDISLYKIIGENRSAVSETNRKIIITIAVPDSLKKADGKTARTFAIIRVHDGQAEILNDLDNSSDTITIETDRFSSYAIIYKDAADSAANDNNSNKADNTNNDSTNTAKQTQVPKTGDSHSLELYATLAMIAGLTYLLLYFANRKKGMTEETNNAPVSKITR